MRFKLTLLLSTIAMLASCQPKDAEAAKEPSTPEYLNEQLPSPSDYPDYDPHLLVPQWDTETNSWVYIDRSSREQVVPLKFHSAGRVQRGVAYATLIDAGSETEDVYRVYPDGTYERIYEGKPGAKKNEKDCMYYRTGDDYFFVNQGSQNALFDPEGKVLWEQECTYQYFHVASVFPAYLGEGRMLVLRGSQYEFKDREFKTVATLDTTKYGIIMYDRHEDWARIDFRVPLVLALDRESEKLGFFDRKGKEVVPFEYSPTPFSEFIHTRLYKEGITIYRYFYKEDRYGHIPVFVKNQNGLIKNDGTPVWMIPKSYRFIGDPQIFFNPSTNQIPLEDSNWEGHNAVFDLRTKEEVAQQTVFATLSDSLYLVGEETGIGEWSCVLKNASFDKLSSPLDSIGKFFSCLPLNEISPKIYSAHKVISDESNSSKSRNSTIRDLISKNRTDDLFPPQNWFAINSQGQVRMFSDALNMKGSENSSMSFQYFKVWYEIGGDTLTVFYSEDLYPLTDSIPGAPVTAESCFDNYHYYYVLNTNDWREESIANALVFVFSKSGSNTNGYYIDFLGNRYEKGIVRNSPH